MESNFFITTVSASGTMVHSLQVTVATKSANLAGYQIPGAQLLELVALKKHTWKLLVLPHGKRGVATCSATSYSQSLFDNKHASSFVVLALFNRGPIKSKKHKAITLEYLQEVIRTVGFVSANSTIEQSTDSLVSILNSSLGNELDKRMFKVSREEVEVFTILDSLKYKLINI